MLHLFREFYIVARLLSADVGPFVAGATVYDVIDAASGARLGLFATAQAARLAVERHLDRPVSAVAA